MACCSGRRADSRGREGEKCDDCRTWEEELYWKRFHLWHFCRILNSEMEFHKQLMIPGKFADNARTILPTKVTLRGPSGASWCAIMKTKGDDMFLSDGWEEFVEAYSLRENNILIFKYDGFSVFDVLIFDGENLCEKESAYFVKKCGHANTLPERPGKRISSEAVMEENDDDRIRKASKQATEEVGKKSADESPKRLEYSKSKFDRTPGKKKLTPHKAAASRAGSRKKSSATSPDILSSSFESLAELGKTIAQNATSILEPEDITEINASYAVEASPQDTRPVHGGWTNESLPYDNTPQYNGSFSAEASPQSGKEVDGNSPSEATPCNVASSRGGRKKGPASHGNKKALAPDVRIQTEASTKNVTSIDRLETQMGVTEDDIPFGSAGSLNKNYASEEGKEALEMAHREMTESSFVVVMRPTGVCKRFTVTVPPAWCRKHLAPRSQDMLLRIGDKTWHTSLSYASGKARICGGWKHFVQENQLELFDVCLFNLTSQSDDDPVTLDVSIFRAAGEGQPLNGRSQEQNVVYAQNYAAG